MQLSFLLDAVSEALDCHLLIILLLQPVLLLLVDIHAYLRFKCMLLLGLFGISDGLFLVRCQAFGPVVDSIVPQHQPVIMVFLAEVLLVVIDELLTILFLFETAVLLFKHD